MWSDSEEMECRRLVELGLNEDLGPVGEIRSDVTSRLIPTGLLGRACISARKWGVIAGLHAVEAVSQAVDINLRTLLVCQDGVEVGPGEVLGSIEGPVASLLVAERTALNFLQYLSGIATLTRQFVKAVEGFPAQILDTRKILPGYRILAKYAVRQGGGHNHRIGLFDAILIKDNHLAAMKGQRSLPGWIALAREKTPKLPLEIEVDGLDQFDEVLLARPDIILLDNMSPGLMRQAVERRNQRAPGVLLEASGGITLETVREVAASGVDRISVGALTHSPPALDIGLDYE